MPARRAELGVGRKCGVAVRTGDDGRSCDNCPTAVRAEVCTPDEGRAAFASRRRRGAARGNRDGEERVELLQPLVECDQLVAPLDEQVLPELVPAVHLQHQAAEIAEPVLPDAQERSSLATEDAGMGERPTRRRLR